MMRILLTGMSGTGKSSLIVALRGRGFRAVDMDEPGWSEYAPDGEWIWREDRVRALLAEDDGDANADADGRALFVSGCAINQGSFYPSFDEIVLLSAPAAVIVERLASRTNNPYGKDPAELAATLHNLETVEPLLRRSATREIDASAPFEQVLRAVLGLVAGELRG
ncbi:AAA family ATPase [Aquisphaera insulae]|uniref:AAA family ATPase n=1 Tax=Aquisphaera insulae TaxID=2712864 RepID=UPI00196BAC3E|nr:AAA family ATPase [Aquisphaera insulae]